jgi:hypothetical protein
VEPPNPREPALKVYDSQCRGILGNETSAKRTRIDLDTHAITNTDGAPTPALRLYVLLGKCFAELPPTAPPGDSSSVASWSPSSPTPHAASASLGDGMPSATGRRAVPCTAGCVRISACSLPTSCRLGFGFGLGDRGRDEGLGLGLGVGLRVRVRVRVTKRAHLVHVVHENAHGAEAEAERVERREGVAEEDDGTQDAEELLGA